jgi:predicted ATP-dependent protease
MKDVLLEDKYTGKIEVIAVRTLNDVLSHALVGARKEGLLKKLALLVAAKRVPSPTAPLPGSDRPAAH